MTLIKELMDWIRERRKWLKSEQKKHPDNKSIELALINLDIFERRFIELAKKDLKRIKNVVTEFDEFKIVDDLEKDIGELE